MGNLILGKEYFEFSQIQPSAETKNLDSYIISMIKKIQPGDLLLVRTPGIGYSIGRKLTRNTHDHIAVVLNKGVTLNIVNPITVIRPISIFCKPNRNPLILRPKWRDMEQRKRFVKEIEKFSNSVYNVKKTIFGVFFTSLYGWLGIRMPMKKLDESAKRWICTEAILISLLKTFPEFKVINNIKLDYHSLGFATINDFLRISKHFPELLKTID